jgi:hypothetical protein
MKTDKNFDCVKMMRDIRDKVSADIIDMNSDQILDYIKSGRNDYEKLRVSHRQELIHNTDFRL